MHKDVSSWSKFLEILKEDEYRFKRTDVKKRKINEKENWSNGWAMRVIDF